MRTSTSIQDNVIELEFDQFHARLYLGMQQVAANEIVIVKMRRDGQCYAASVIEKESDQLTPDDIKKYRALVEEAIRKELKSFSDLRTVELARRGSVSNTMTSTWVLRWKLVDGKRVVKAR